MLQRYCTRTRPRGGRRKLLWDTWLHLRGLFWVQRVVILHVDLHCLGREFKDSMTPVGCIYKVIAWPFGTYHWIMIDLNDEQTSWQLIFQRRGVFNCSFFFRFCVNQILVDIRFSHVQKQLATQATPAPMYTEWPDYFVFSICIKMLLNLRMLERFQKIFQPKHTLRPSGLRRKFENSVRSIRMPAVEMAWVRLLFCSPRWLS